MLYFVPALFRLAVGGMLDVVGGFADVGRLTDKRGLTDAPPAIGWLSNVVRARSQRLLARGGCGGLLRLPNCRFANNCRFGGILATIGLGRRARWRARHSLLRHSSLEGRPLLRGQSWRVVAVWPAGEDSAILGSGHTSYRQQQQY